MDYHRTPDLRSIVKSISGGNAIFSYSEKKNLLTALQDIQPVIFPIDLLEDQK